MMWWKSPLLIKLMTSNIFFFLFHVDLLFVNMTTAVMMRINWTLMLAVLFFCGDAVMTKKYFTTELQKNTLWLYFISKTLLMHVCAYVNILCT